MDNLAELFNIPDNSTFEVNEDYAAKNLEPVQYENMSETLAELQSKADQQSFDLLDMQVATAELFMDVAVEWGPDMDAETMNLLSSCIGCQQYQSELTTRIDDLKQQLKTDALIYNDNGYNMEQQKSQIHAAAAKKHVVPHDDEMLTKFPDKKKAKRNDEINMGEYMSDYIEQREDKTTSHQIMELCED